MRHDNNTNIKSLIKTFIIAWASMMVLLLVTTAIPNSALQRNQEKAHRIIEKETNYPKPFFNKKPAMLDNFTDAIIIREAIKDDNDSLLQAAMHRGYSRYWQGHAVYMRPLLVFFSLYQIRYILMMSYMILLGGASLLIAKKNDSFTSIAFITTIAMTYPVIVATSLQYFPMFAISFTAIIVELIFLKTVKEKSAEFFMIVGMITSFIDLLTVPLITLGLPLIVLVKTANQNGEQKNCLRTVAKDTLSWGLGYGIMWASKWVIGSIILREKVFETAKNAIAFRTLGNDEYAGRMLGDRIQAVADNYKAMFFSEGKSIAAILAVVIVCLLLLSLIKRKKDKGIMTQSLSLLIIALFPYIWYFVLSNHSIIHSWFTYRAQSVTLFAILVSIGNLINWKMFNNNKLSEDDN